MTFFGEKMFSKVVQRKIAAAMLHDLIIGKSLVTRVLFFLRPKGGKFILSSGNRLQEYPVCPGNPTNLGENELVLSYLT